MSMLKVATSLALILWAAVKVMEKIFFTDEKRALKRLVMKFSIVFCIMNFWKIRDIWQS